VAQGDDRRPDVQFGRRGGDDLRDATHYWSSASTAGWTDAQGGVEFAARWSIPAGQAAFVLLLFLPPFRDFMTSLVIEFGGHGPGMTVDRSVVVFAMALGFMGVVMLQAIATMVFNVIWWKSKQ
jgi:hypothetical protein